MRRASIFYETRFELQRKYIVPTLGASSFVSYSDVNQ
jgi:hypothetical protein